MKTIALTQNQETIVSDEDFEYLSGFNWFTTSNIRSKNHTSYARRHQSKSEYDDISKRKCISMHRAIAERMGLDLTNFIDHIDGDGLNNQRENLRAATQQQNNQNRIRKQKGCSSRYKGVSWRKRRQKWCAEIRINSVSIHLGIFGEEIEAALAYNEAATKHHGEFAALNIILEQQIN